MSPRKKKDKETPPTARSAAPSAGRDVVKPPTTELAPPREAEIVDDGASVETPLAIADPLTRYFAELRRYPRLTREEERELAERFRSTGDREAAQRLATANLRLVVRIAMDYRRAYLNFLDLIQEGNIGLLHAIKRYDPFRGVPFSAYAGYWIRAYVLKYLLDHWSLVRVGTTNVRRKLFFNLKREQQRLRSEGIDPGPKLLAQNLGADESDVIEVSRALKGRDLSIDQPSSRSGEEDSRPIWETMAADVVGPEEQVAREQMQSILKEKIGAFSTGLKEKERYILEKRLLADEPLTLQAIGDHYGTTREAVRQIEARLVRKLRDFLRSEIKDLKHFEVKPD